MDAFYWADADNRADTVRPYNKGVDIRADVVNRVDNNNRADAIRPYDRLARKYNTFQKTLLWHNG